MPHPTEATADMLAALTCSARAVRQQGFGRTHSSSESHGRSSFSVKVEISERMVSTSPVGVTGNITPMRKQLGGGNTDHVDTVVGNAASVELLSPDIL